MHYVKVKLRLSSWSLEGILNLCVLYKVELLPRWLLQSGGCDKYKLWLMIVIRLHSTVTSTVHSTQYNHHSHHCPTKSVKTPISVPLSTELIMEGIENKSTIIQSLKSWRIEIELCTHHCPEGGDGKLNLFVYFLNLP